MQPEGLPDGTPDPVAAHGISDRLRADRHPQAGVATFVRQVVDTEESVTQATTGLARSLEFRSSAELLDRSETLAGRDARSRQRDRPAARRVRPLARRRFSTCRPFLVAMRARNPCVRFRFTLLGWYVRFMAATLNLH